MFESVYQFNYRHRWSLRTIAFALSLGVAVNGFDYLMAEHFAPPGLNVVLVIVTALSIVFMISREVYWTDDNYPVKVRTPRANRRTALRAARRRNVGVVVLVLGSAFGLSLLTGMMLSPVLIMVYAGATLATAFLFDRLTVVTYRWRHRHDPAPGAPTAPGSGWRAASSLSTRDKNILDELEQELGGM